MLKIIATLFLVQVAFAVNPIVRIKDGVLRGSILKDMDGESFLSFQRIPYAKPPIGKLRFKDPQPVEGWSGERDATKEAPMCLQNKFFYHGEFAGEEDCLYLNVYTRELTPKKLKPVIVYIHGGGFVEGSGNYSAQGPNFLLPQDVVVVTLNYRLGILGFISFDDPSLNASGNAGLKDQNLALKWINTNIKSFGGGSNQVTLMGESAGAACAHFHILSPHSQGLFQRAILQSGNALTPWTNGQFDNGVATAKYLGFKGSNRASMLKFLQDASTRQLKTVSVNTTTLMPFSTQNRYGPIVERKSHNAFLSDTPRNIIKSGNYNRKIQVLMGTTSAEGMVLDIQFILRDGYYIPWPTDHFIPYYFNLNSSQKAKLSGKLNRFYNLDDTTNPNNHFALASDTYFTFSIYEFLYGHKNDIYLYLFNSDSKLNSLKYSNEITKKYRGTSHVDDLWYFFTHVGTPPAAYTSGSIENKAIKNSVRLFTNFAKYGKPTLLEDAVQWEKTGRDSIKSFVINLDKNQPGGAFFKRRADFWCDIYEEYNQEHFCTSRWS